MFKIELKNDPVIFYGFGALSSSIFPLVFTREFGWLRCRLLTRTSVLKGEFLPSSSTYFSLRQRESGKGVAGGPGLGLNRVERTASLT